VQGGGATTAAGLRITKETSRADRPLPLTSETHTPKHDDDDDALEHL